jgi:hypothetical protein
MKLGAARQKTPTAWRLLVIAFPSTVTVLLDVDLNKVKIEVPQIDLPPLDLGKRKQ